jgi:hypothetical protein
MADLLKRTEEYYLNNEAEAEAFIKQAKETADTEGYELASYKMVKKDKKSKGEIVDSWVIVTLVKKWEC